MSPSLLERVIGAFRERVRGVVRDAPAWHDLDDDGRRAAFEATLASRALEAALDPDGLSTTARAVLSRLPERE